MLSLDINHDIGIIIQKQSGEIKQRDLKNAWLTILEMKSFRFHGYDLLSDFRDGKLVSLTDEIKRAREFFTHNRETLNGKKEAIITSDPYTSAMCQLFERYAMECAGMQIRIFSTEKAALKWLINCKYSCHCNIENCRMRV